MLIAFSALLVGDDLVPLVFGPAYRPVAVNLVPLTLALLPLALSSAANLLALVHDRPGLALQSAGVLLVAFWAMGPPLIAAWGSLGACLAVLGASALYAGVFTWRMERVTRYSLRSWALAILLGVPFLPLVLFRSSGPVNMALYGAFAVGYGGLLLLLRVITAGELAAMWRAVGPQRRGERP
jgi:O-antigen/teichoic acid export membrane protein